MDHYLQFGVVTADLEYLREIRSPMLVPLGRRTKPVDIAERILPLVAADVSVHSQQQEDTQEYWNDVVYWLSDSPMGLREILSGLSHDEATVLLAKSHILSCKPGDALILKGHTSRTLYVLLSGSLEVHDDGEVVACVEEHGAILGRGGYSAGSTQTGPYGFRKLHARASLLDAAGSRWPELVAALGERTILTINAYPAAIGASVHAITVDTYLSPRVLSRALQLGKVGDHPVILIGQPLFLADALLRHLAAERPLPETLMLWVGGYVMPRSLERMLESLLAPQVSQLLLVQYFGAAEVDAGCMMARERTAEGELIYYPRDDVEPGLDGDDLLLTLRAPDGTPIIERFRTGDLTRRSGEGWVLWNPKRLHPVVRAALESWSESDWKRRTGAARGEQSRVAAQGAHGSTRASFSRRARPRRCRRRAGSCVPERRTVSSSRTRPTRPRSTPFGDRRSGARSLSPSRPSTA